MKEPLVSIILPTYNGAMHLEKALKSVFSQSYRNLECLVVIDGSMDNTAEVLSRFSDRRLVIIEHDVNRGLPASLNSGFRRAKGEYLTWTSDDNEFLPHAIERLIFHLQKDETVGLVYSAWEAIAEHAEEEQGSVVWPGCPSLCTMGCNQVGCCFLFTRQCYERTGEYDESIQGVEDYEYWIRARKHFPFKAVREILYRYRLHANSLTSKYPKEIRALVTEVKRQQLPLDDLQFLPAFNDNMHQTPEIIRFGRVNHAIDETLLAELLGQVSRENIAAVVTITPNLPAIDEQKPGANTIGYSLLDPICRANVLKSDSTVDSLFCFSTIAKEIGLSENSDPSTALDRIGAFGGNVALLCGSIGADDSNYRNIPYYYHAGKHLSKGFRFRTCLQHFTGNSLSLREGLVRLPFYFGVYLQKIKEYEFAKRSK